MRDDDLRQVFASYCRLTKRQLEEQTGTLRVLFDAAATADASIPDTPDVDISNGLASLRLEERLALSDFFDAERKGIGARDAYATALVIYLDSLLKTLWAYFQRIPDTNQNLTVRVCGVSVGLILHEAANNVRHYMDWTWPDISPDKLRQAVTTCKAIATVLDLETPTGANIQGYGTNFAWRILLKIGDSTFDGLLDIVKRYQEELISNAGVSDLVRMS